MQLTLAVISIIMAGAAVYLFMNWFVPFSLLMRRIRRRHKVYYSKVGRPRGNDTAKVKRRLAWFRTLRRVFKGVPRNFLSDKECQRLASLSRNSLRTFVPIAGIAFLVLAPVDGFIFVLNRPLVDTAVVASNNSGSPHGSSGGANTQPTVTSGSNSIVEVPTPKLKTTVTHVLSVAPTEPTTPPAGSVSQIKFSHPINEQSPLTKVDLSTALATVGSPGQKRASKQDVCTQLTTNNPVADEVYPTDGSDICTNANLLTYSTY